MSTNMLMVMSGRLHISTLGRRCLTGMSLCVIRLSHSLLVIWCPGSRPLYVSSRRLVGLSNRWHCLVMCRWSKTAEYLDGAAISTCAYIVISRPTLGCSGELMVGCRALRTCAVHLGSRQCSKQINAHCWLSTRPAASHSVACLWPTRTQSQAP
jgi:hypothetical protein